MADKKISELPELLPYDDYIDEGGVSDLDYITLLDVSEQDINLINKKVRLQTLHESLAPINSPEFSGTPTTLSPPLADNSNRIPTTSWVKNQFTSIDLNTLADVDIPNTPLANQTLIYNNLTSSFEAGYTNAVIRETLSSDKTLLVSSETYQFLSPGGANRNIVLPSGEKGVRFVIKNLDTNFDLYVTENSGEPAAVTININSPIAEIIHDGTEYHVIQY